MAAMANLENHRVSRFRYLSFDRLPRGRADPPDLSWGRDMLDCPSVDHDMALGIIATVGPEGHL